MKKLNLLSLFMGFTFLLFGQQQNTTHDIILQAFQEAGLTSPTSFNNNTTSALTTPPLEWLQDSSYTYSWNADDWYLQGRTISETRDEYGNLLTSISTETENATTPWEPSSRIVRTYHDPSTLATFVRFRWNTDTQEWVETNNYILDENGNFTSVILLSWNAFDNTITGGVQANYTYDGELLLEYIIYRWEMNDWVEDTKVINTYNADNLLESSLQQEWDQGWVNQSRRNYEYNTDNLVQANTRQIWDDPSQTFINQQLEELSYTTALEIENRLTSLWNTTANNWEISSKSEYTYNSSDLVTHIIDSDWIDPDWITTFETENEYDSENNIIRSSGYNINPYGEWDWGSSQEIFEFDGNNNRTRRTRQIWDIYEQTFINSSRTDYFFSLQDIMLDVADHKNSQLKVSPNPSRGVFNITTESQPTSNLNIKVTDISGRNILTTTASGSNHTIDLSNQASGLYFLYVNDAIPQKIVLK